MNRLTGGPQANHFMVLASRPKVGKSMLVSGWLPWIAHQAAQQGKVVRVVTLETTMASYQSRSAAMLARLNDPLNIRRGMLNKDEVDRYYRALAKLRDLPIEYLSNERDLDMTPEQAMRDGASGVSLVDIRKFVAQRDTFLWVIDHIGLIATDTYSADRMVGITNGLTDLAHKFVGGIAITHLTRASVGGIPSIESLSSTDQLGRNADALYLIYRPFAVRTGLTPEQLATIDGFGGDPGAIFFKSRDEGAGTVGVVWKSGLASFVEADWEEDEIPLPTAPARR